jgi:hypothetical protein
MSTLVFSRQINPIYSSSGEISDNFTATVVYLSWFNSVVSESDQIFPSYLEYTESLYYYTGIPYEKRQSTNFAGIALRFEAFASLIARVLMKES